MSDGKLISLDFDLHEPIESILSTVDEAEEITAR